MQCASYMYICRDFSVDFYKCHLLFHELSSSVLERRATTTSNVNSNHTDHLMFLSFRAIKISFLTAVHSHAYECMLFNTSDKSQRQGSCSEEKRVCGELSFILTTHVDVRTYMCTHLTTKSWLHVKRRVVFHYYR